MPVIGVTAGKEHSARRYIESMERRGASVLPLRLEGGSSPQETIGQIQGLLLTGGADVDPAYYGQAPDPKAGLETNPERDALELPLLKGALERNIPVLAICRGMQLLNVAFGGQLIQDLPGHRAENKDGRWESAYHRVFVSPGSKLSAIMGGAPFYRVNSRHHQGLREPQKSPRLLACAYSEEDGIIEGLESPAHRFVIGVQWHPEREDELNIPSLLRVFDAFIAAAEE